MIIPSRMPVDGRLARLVTGLMASLLVGLVIPLSASAQLGLRGGLSLSNLAGSGVQTSEKRQGFTGAMGWTLFHLGPLEIAPELSYVQKGTGDLFLAAQQPGGDLAGNPPPSADFVEFGIDYLEVPVLARLVMDLPVGSDGTAAYVLAGPALAWRLQCSIRPSGEGNVEVSDGCQLPQFRGASDVVRSADRGTVLGGGLLLTVGSIGQVTFNARMIRGIGRVATDPNQPEARNRAFLFTLGWDLNGVW